MSPTRRRPAISAASSMAFRSTSAHHPGTVMTTSLTLSLACSSASSLARTSWYASASSTGTVSLLVRIAGDDRAVVANTFEKRDECSWDCGFEGDCPTSNLTDAIVSCGYRVACFAGGCRNCQPALTARHQEEMERTRVWASLPTKRSSPR